jgi:hypothetical protein
VLIFASVEEVTFRNVGAIVLFSVLLLLKFEPFIPVCARLSFIVKYTSSVVLPVKQQNSQGVFGNSIGPLARG